MSTFLFDEIIFGPVKSRRLGVSLGVNLLPTDSKNCNYNCIYCECGWSNSKIKNEFLPADLIISKLENYLKSHISNGIEIDAITFAGNGEPTLHPDFLKIINETIKLRNIYLSNAKIVVLTNATNLAKVDVVEGLNKIDMAILKIDTINQQDYEFLNGVDKSYSISKIVDEIILKIKKPIIQTMFLKAKFKDKHFDNTTEESLKRYFSVLEKISPELVMIYSIARDTPMGGLENINIEDLRIIGNKIEKLGFKTLVTA